MPAAGNSLATAAGPLEDSVASLSERLRRDPDDHRGWFLLGLAWRETERLAEAETAFRRAMELAPGNADYVAYLAEAMLLRRRETAPDPEAERLFRRALELDRSNPQARYYLATIRDFRGDHRGAVDGLVALLREAPPGAPWAPQVRAALEGIAQRRGIDLAGRLPPPEAAAATSATAAIPGPTREQMEAARAIPPGEQDAMVRAMVAQLAARLRTNPRDADGWIRLMRSRMVLQDPAGARAALAGGLAAFRGDEAVSRRLRSAAAELGVPGG